jgi:sec-independent protein translocase protein TatC
VTEATSHDEPQSLLSHLNELRWRIIKAALGIGVGSTVGLVFANPITDFLAIPYRNSCADCEFQFIAPTESFSVLMKVAVFVGLILGSPVVLYQIWAFISPALTSKERKWVVPVIAASVTLFVAGIAFGYWSLPRAFDFFLSIFPDVESRLRLGDYYSFVVRFLLAFGFSFLYPVFLFGLAAAGVISSRQLGSGRRWAVLVIVIASAAITPTGDIITLSLLSAPLYLFYEITYWLVRLVLRK